jgi:hypothetical protein
MPFTRGLVTVKEIDPVNWELVHAVIYRGKHDSFTVPAGFITDFATVPRIFVWLVPTYGAYTKAAILHDYLLSSDVVTDADANGIFRRAMHELGVPFVTRWVMWAGVSWGVSRLRGMKPADFARWIIIAVPALIFLAVPAAVVTAWLFLYWLIELLFYVFFFLIGRRDITLPRFRSLPRRNRTGAR